VDGVGGVAREDEGCAEACAGHLLDAAVAEQDVAGSGRRVFVSGIVELDVGVGPEGDERGPQSLSVEFEVRVSAKDRLGILLAGIEAEEVAEGGIVGGVAEGGRLDVRSVVRATGDPGVDSSFESARKWGQARVVFCRNSLEPPLLVLTCQGQAPLLSVVKMRRARPTFLRLLAHLTRLDFARARAMAGMARRANAMITTRTMASSGSVKALMSGSLRGDRGVMG